MKVGTLGNVVFEVSDTRVFTPSQVTRESGPMFRKRRNKRAEGESCVFEKLSLLSCKTGATR